MRTWISKKTPGPTSQNAAWVDLGDGRLLQLTNSGTFNVVSTSSTVVTLRENLEKNTQDWEQLLW